MSSPEHRPCCQAPTTDDTPNRPELKESPESPEGAEAPVVVIDPDGADPHGEMARLRAAGPVVRIALPGLPDDVHAWTVTRQDLLGTLSRDRSISRNINRHWAAYRDGRVPDDWPLAGMFLGLDNMFFLDDPQHRRLRNLVSGVFTARRVHDLTGDITRIVGEALDALPGHRDQHGAVDLRAHFAYTVPMGVICHLLGIPDPVRPRFRAIVDVLLRSDDTKTAWDAAAAETSRLELLDDLVELRRAAPGTDLTSDLITAWDTGARDGEAEGLSHRRLLDTLWMLVVAGHETTFSLITNAVRALLTHPDVRARVPAFEADDWSAVVEETLRWDGVINYLAAGCTTTPLTIGGVTIPVGQLLVGMYGGVGRDAGVHGPTAHLFDPARADHTHLAFGVGAHYCLGAPLARAETRIALGELFARYPDLHLAAPPDQLVQVPSLFTNCPRELPVGLELLPSPAA
ncbi:cytochrome P450 [Actinomadura sp. KC216]|nr:cytochrome P450 [Actinomadura sp. KC216]TDB78747.1 cytochrome P450 [Actinomadura sp. KC216]